MNELIKNIGLGLFVNGSFALLNGIRYSHKKQRIWHDEAYSKLQSYKRFSQASTKQIEKLFAQDNLIKVFWAFF